MLPVVWRRRRNDRDSNMSTDLRVGLSASARQRGSVDRRPPQGKAVA